MDAGQKKMDLRKLSFTQKKNGQVNQIILFFVVVFAMVVTVLLGKHILNEFYSAIDEAGINTAAMTQAQADMEEGYAVFDFSILFASIVMIIGLMISSFMIPTHPIFIVINVIGIFILVFMGMVMNNVYGELVSGADQVLGDEADGFPLSNYLITNLPFIGAIIILITSIIMFTRST